MGTHTPILRRMVLVVLLLVMVLAALPLTGSAQGTSDAARACQGEGYLAYTDAGGTAFKNPGECTRYAAMGNTLEPVVVPDPVVPDPDLSISGGLSGADGTVSGTGFTPNSMIVSMWGTSAAHSEFGQPLLWIQIPTDANGAFTTLAELHFCQVPNTGMEITVTDAGGVRYTEFFPLDCVGA